MSMSRDEFRILSADHTGITVSNLEHSLVFWRDVLGFELGGDVLVEERGEVCGL